MSILAHRERAFLGRQRIGHLATASKTSVPHVVPVCFALEIDTLYTAIDEKPKSGKHLRRLRNIAENSRATFVADCYDEDWSRLGWVMLEGDAQVFDRGSEFDIARTSLSARYEQYRTMSLSSVIALRIAIVRSWGNLGR